VWDLYDCGLNTAALGVVELQHHLGSLQGATQLQELYLRGSSVLPPCNEALAQLFPVSLKHLGWDGELANTMTAEFAHLTSLTALQLLRWSDISSTSSSSLPPGVQQLELEDEDELSQEVLVEQQAKLVLLPSSNDWEEREEVLDQLSHYTNLGGLRVTVDELARQGRITTNTLAQLPRLSALTVWNLHPDGSSDSVMSAACSIPRLRWLTLTLISLMPPPALSMLTGLQRLTLQLIIHSCDQQQQQQQAAWGQQLGGLTGLRWLSVPNGLVGTLAPWLGSLQQLRVLMVVWSSPSPGREPAAADDVSSVPWLEGFSSSMLPPRLQLLGLTGTNVQPSQHKQLRRRLQQALGGSACEVVVGVHLDEVGDGLWFQARWPHALLAGWPSVLQQALA
jgi:hypothetical protein